MANARVLVTGGRGFIGSHLVDALLVAGCTVRVLDDLSSHCVGHKLPVAVDEWEGSILNKTVCDLATVGCDAVFHLAARSRSAESLTNPDVSVNVLGTHNILTAAKNNNVRRVIYSGSSTYYGNACPLSLSIIVCASTDSTRFGHISFSCSVHL